MNLACYLPLGTIKDEGGSTVVLLQYLLDHSLFFSLDYGTNFSERTPAQCHFW